MSKSLHIYTIQNKKNKKRYIGHTTQNPLRRWRQHLKLARQGKKTHLHAAIRKHGVDSFSFLVIKTVKWSKSAHVVLEKNYIERYKPEYNMTIGGAGTLGYKYTKEQRLERSSQLLAYYKIQSNKDRHSRLCKKFWSGRPGPRTRKDAVV